MIKVTFRNKAISLTVKSVSDEITYQDVAEALIVVCAGLGIDYDSFLDHLAEFKIIEAVEEAIKTYKEDGHPLGWKNLA